jgi:D-amino-acid dehydrogenase
MLRLLFNCRRKPYLINKERILRLAEYSRYCIDELRAETGIQYEGRQLGTTQILRTRKQFKNISTDIQVLEKFGVPHEVLNTEGVQRVEPALGKARVKLTGGVNFPHDQTGDCHLFTQELAELAKKLGASFHFDQNISRLEKNRNKITGVWIENKLHQADHYLVAMGSFSTPFLHSFGLHIPVYPFKGYSLTANITQAQAAPRSTILDESYKVAITRLGERIRVGGMAEIIGYDLNLNPRRKETLTLVARQLFPQAADYSQVDFWCGLRPATPDSTPLVGASPYENLWLNTGHGTLGWTMACGSARLLADLIAAKTPDIKAQDLSMLRYANKWPSKNQI